MVGSGHQTSPGGKGANQAVAASRLGARSALIGAVGKDEAGDGLVTGLNDEGVDTTAVGRSETPTGAAFITVDRDAENTIVVSPGANSDLTVAHVNEQSDLLRDARVVLAQLEVPLEAVMEAARLTTGTFILNPAPATALPAELLAETDILVVNRSELAILADAPEATNTPAAVEQARSMPTTTVITLGKEGALLANADQWAHHQAVEVEAVDPTGAGDTFCGAIAAQLSQGSALADAIPFAVAAGALAVTKVGAQAAMPSRADVEALMRR